MERVICNFGKMEIDRVSLMQTEGFSELIITTEELETLDNETLKKYNKQNIEIKGIDSKIGLEITDIQEIENIFHLAKQARIKVVITYGFPQNSDNDEAIEKYREIANIAKQNGLTLVIRNSTKTMLNRADLVLGFVKALDVTNVKIMLDTGEYVHNNEMIIPAYRHLKEDLAVIFLDDVNTYFDSVPFGMGEAKISDFLAMLKKDGYKGSYIINLDFALYSKRKEIYKTSKINFFARLKPQYKSCRLIDEKLGKSKKDDISNKYLATLQLRYLKKII